MGEWGQSTKVKSARETYLILSQFLIGSWHEELFTRTLNSYNWLHHKENVSFQAIRTAYRYSEKCGT